MESTINCHICGKPVNEKSRKCPHCGGKLKKKLLKHPFCPRCKIPLSEKVFEKEKINFCNNCKGMWIDYPEFRRLTSEALVFQQCSFREEYVNICNLDNSSYIPCVRCDKFMNRKNFAKISGVLLDECFEHGLWFDAGELQKIRHFIYSGGLQEAQDKKIEETRLELASLKTKVDTVSYTQDILDFWNLKRMILKG